MYNKSTENIRQAMTFLGAGVPAGLRSMAASITLDIWTSRANKGYMCVLLHTCNARFVLTENCIGIKEFDKHHTYDKIAEHLKAFMDDLGISLSVIVRVVTDGGSNVVKAIQYLGLKHERCVDHMLQRVIINSISKVPAFGIVMTRAKALVRYFHKSALGMSYLRDAQSRTGTAQHKLVQSNETRWNSFYECAIRLMEQRHALANAFEQDATRPASQRVLPHDKKLSSDDWALLTDIVSVLHPLREASDNHTIIIIWMHNHRRLNIGSFAFGGAPPGEQIATGCQVCDSAASSRVHQQAQARDER